MGRGGEDGAATYPLPNSRVGGPQAQRGGGMGKGRGATTVAEAAVSAAVRVRGGEAGWEWRIRVGGHMGERKRHQIWRRRGEVVAFVVTTAGRLGATARHPPSPASPGSPDLGVARPPPLDRTGSGGGEKGGGNGSCR
uniref:Uncharacterized protein n=1 Tax=Leersia perrieri TaxID=77586 RepID=A0A0D9W2U7_9ORYZ